MGMGFCLEVDGPSTEQAGQAASGLRYIEPSARSSLDEGFDFRLQGMARGSTGARFVPGDRGRGHAEDVGRDAHRQRERRTPSLEYPPPVGRSRLTGGEILEPGPKPVPCWHERASRRCLAASMPIATSARSLSMATRSPSNSLALSYSMVCPVLVRCRRTLAGIVFQSGTALIDVPPGSPLPGRASTLCWRPRRSGRRPMQTGTQRGRRHRS